MPEWAIYLLGVASGVFLCAWIYSRFERGARYYDLDEGLRVKRAREELARGRLAHRGATVWIDGRELTGAHSVYIQSAPGSSAGYGSAEPELQGEREYLEAGFEPRVWNGDHA